jgi:hypothetical protein
MERNDYKLLTRSQHGPKVRGIFTAAANRIPPSRTDLAGMMDSANITDAATRSWIEDRCVELARQARDGASRMALLGKADEHALELLHEFRRNDSLIEDEVDSEATAEDLAAGAAAAEATRHADSIMGGQEVIKYEDGSEVRI